MLLMVQDCLLNLHWISISPLSPPPAAAPPLVVKHVDGMNLTLHHVSRTDMGAYMCIASNRVPPSVSKRFEVKVNCK